jgi:ankyrin repeat protein
MLNPGGLVTLPPLAQPSSSTLSFWATFTMRATSAMPLLNLPNELLQNISENLESERDINVIAQANCRLYCLLDSYLYRYNVQQSGSSALLWAARHGQEVTARKLLREKANIQDTNNDDQTPLLLAVEKGLIDKGANVNAQGEHYGNALQVTQPEAMRWW